MVATTKTLVTLRDLRQEAGLSLRDLERRSGISRGHLSRFERGLAAPLAGELRLIEDALGQDEGSLRLGIVLILDEVHP